MMDRPMDREALLADIRRVARLLDKDWVSRAEFQRHGTVGVKRVMRSFGTWNKAVMAAGLAPLEQGRGATRTRKVQGPEDIINEIKRVARLLDKPSVSLKEFERNATFSVRPIWRVFGTWSAAVKAAGLTALPKATRIPDQELEAEFMRVYADLGKVPTVYEFDSRAKFSSSTYIAKFGGWRRVAAHYLSHEPPPQARLASQRPAAGARPAPGRFSRQRPVSAEAARGRRLFGAPLNFRGLQHEPVNEQGVVFLFGMVARELGFLVDAVQTGFPDCRAKERAKGGRYVEVDIEFEFKSSHFRDQGHDPKGCDLVVCWEHDWPKCPVRVLELRSAIQGLDPNA
jgi:hypothetical protein